MWRHRPIGGQAQGPVLTREIISQWIAANPGRGAFWSDHGQGGTLLCDPVSSKQSQALADTRDQPMPQQLGPDEFFAGYCSYDLPARELAQLPEASAKIPHLLMRRYQGALHLHDDQSYQCSPDLSFWPSLRAFAQTRVSPAPTPWPYAAPSLLWAKERYESAFARIQQYLREGETYQINLSQPLQALASAPASDLARACCCFAYLAEHRPAPHGVLIDIDGQCAIVSNSPELLFSIEQEGGAWKICSAPIKGTRPRAKDPTQDERLAQELITSPKDAAEHLMIVDLIRNDLVRIARPGSVMAPSTPRLLSLPTVHHLETRITATLRPEIAAPDLWRALAPGGSVTGAPKRRSVELIHELEQAPRGIYCGSIWMVTHRGMWANLAIRTALARDGALHLRSGGGIVLDSEVDKEWQETLDKAQAFFGPRGSAQ